MHGGRASNDGKQGGGGGKKVMTKNCDLEHEEHEALVKHYEVGIGIW